MAELVAYQNSVVRDFAGSIGRWQRTSRGDIFRIGDGLKTGKTASARLRIYPDGQMLVESETLVRFQAAAPGEPEHQVQVETGSIQIDSVGADLQIHTLVGTARIERGSRVQVRAGSGASELKVLVGGVQVDRQGKRFRVPAGESLSLEIGDLVVDKKAFKADTGSRLPSPTARADAAVGEPGAQTPVTENESPAPEFGARRADFAISAGESATVHDPNPPTMVRIPIAGCEAGGVVEVGRSGRFSGYAAARGDGSAVVRLAPGRYSYRVRCLKRGKEGGRVSARGYLSIQRDPGLRQLPKKPVDVSIDADGRSYTVRYQNLLPRLTFVWPDPPVSSLYTINVDSEGASMQVERASQPRYTFSSGRIGEGNHRFSFATPEGRRSPTGKLSIAFDNTARTASLSEPVEGTPTSGQKVSVSGTALMHSRVSIAGAEISTDAQGRFKTEIVAPADDTAIAVRVQHGAAKIHYYLRHLSGRPALQSSPASGGGK